MRGSKSSANSPSSEPAAAGSLRAGATLLELSLVIALAALSSGWAIWYFAGLNELYGFGDAEAHLNIARRILDNREPAYREIGTVWLPLPHLLTMPFAASDALWQNGFAGTIPAALSFVAAAGMWFAALRRIASPLAAWCGTAVLVANPNLLYLQSTAMTEPVMLAALAGLFLSTVAYTQERSRNWLVWAAVFSTAASLTRYEGWFLIPFVTVFFWRVGGLRAAVEIGALASMAPVYWLAHNWWLFGDALYFYRGPWSAKAIYARQLAQGMGKYPADGDWFMAWLYFRTAVELVVGKWLLWMGGFGILAAVLRRWWWAAGFVALPPLFYLWSLYSSGTPIFVPVLWPHSYYNTRYALAALPLLALGVAGVMAWLGGRAWPVRLIGTLVLSGAVIATWRADWTVRREGLVNSKARREWTNQAARVLASVYQAGDGIIYSFGDQTGILRAARIPLRETLHDGNEQEWVATLARPELLLRERWAIVFPGDPVAQALARAVRHGIQYTLIQRVIVNGAQPVEIYRRESSAARLGAVQRNTELTR